MSLNAATVKSINDNLMAILDGFDLYKFEKDSVDPKINTWVQLNVGADTEDENHGEGPMYIEQRFEIVAHRQIEDKSDHRIKGAEIKWDIKEAITVEVLNVGDLEESNLISRIEMDSSVNDYNSSEGLVVTVDLVVRFRDLRT